MQTVWIFQSRKSLKIIMNYKIFTIFLLVLNLIEFIEGNDAIKTLMIKWIKRYPKVNLIATVDIAPKRDESIAKKITRSIPEGYTVMHLNFLENQDDVFGEAAFIIIFSDVYSTVSEII